LFVRGSLTGTLRAKCWVKKVNTLASGRFWGFLRKKRTWLCAGISPVRLQTWSKCQKTRQAFWSALEKNFFWLGVWIFCEWCHKWRTFRPP